VAYTIYALFIISLIGWFAYNLTRKEKAKSVVRIPFYGYMAFLVAGGVGHHIFTYNAIPWVEEDIIRHDLKPDQVVKGYIENHKWNVDFPIKIKANTRVLFDIDSKDLMYGFGIFRKDGTMVTQMQVNPGSRNDLMWTFRECGKFDVTSTEYSGPNQYSKDGSKDLMFVKDAVIVEGCDKGEKK
jgi:cytochrome c oxidase subunit 2